MALAATSGYWLSITTTSCWHSEWLPLPSVAPHVMVLVPTGYEKAALLVTTGAASHESVTIGNPKEILVAAQVPASAITVTGAGQVNPGAMLSITVSTAIALLVVP